MTKTIPNTIFKRAWLLLLLSGAGCASSPQEMSSRLLLQSPKCYFAATADDWKIAVYHYYPVVLDRAKSPLLLVPGPNYNAAFWAVHEKADFARYLAKHGWDVWAVSLRGTGRSSRPGYTPLDLLGHLPLVQKRSGVFQFKSFDWTLDDCIAKDLPAVLALVQRRTQAKKITLIGEGFGGSIVLAYAGLNAASFVDRVVAIAPPMKFILPTPDVFEQISENPAPQTSLKSPIKEVLFFNSDDVDIEVQNDCENSAMESIPPGVLKQFSQLVKTGELTSADQQINYAQNVAKIRIPVLLLSGKKDNMAPTEGVLALYEKLTTADKTIREFSRANFYKVDYGHDDLILGKRAKKEVYPYIEHWLKRRK